MWIEAWLVVWAGSLVCLWSWTFDSSGGSVLVTLAAVAFAHGAVASIPRRLVRIARWSAAMLGYRDVPAIDLLVSRCPPRGPAGEQAAGAALVTAVIFAVVGALLSTAAVFLGAVVAGALAGALLWTPLAWTGAKLMVQFVGMLPMAAGTAAVLYTLSVCRRGYGRDPYGALCRQVLWAAGFGAAAFGLAWWGGVHMLVLVTAAVVMLLGAAAVVYRWKGLHVGCRSPAGGRSAGRRERAAVMVGAASLAVVLLIQGRLMADIANLGFGLRVICWGVSLALLAAFVRRADRKSRPPGRAQECGAAIGVAAVLAIQIALAAATLQGGRAATVCAAWALVAQVPLLVLASIILSRQRRLFAASGGPVASYVGRVCAGVGLGALFYMIVCSFAAGYLMLAAAAAIVCGVCTVPLALRDRIPGDKFRWGLSAAVLAVAVGGAALASLWRGRSAVGRATPGFWLTGVSGPDNPGGAAGYLPVVHSWRSDRITRAVSRVMVDPEDRELLRGHRGTWWTVAGAPRDLPAPLPFRIYERGSAADPAAVPPGIWPDVLLVRGMERHFLLAAQTGEERFDGVFLSPLPADHPQAWRCYNYRILRRCRNRLHEDGVLVLRTQAGAERLSAALAVAKTFHKVMGPSWAVADFHHGTIDLLLVGPAHAVPWASWRQDLPVVRTDRLADNWQEIPRIYLARPPGPFPKWRPAPATLESWFQRAAEVSSPDLGDAVPVDRSEGAQEPR